MIARCKRLIAAAILALAVIVSSWVRVSPDALIIRDNTFSSVEVAGAGAEQGGFTLAGAWRLTSSDTRFGGYSALLLRKDGGLTAISDTGRFLKMSRPDDSRRNWHRFGHLRTNQSLKLGFDVEAATADPGKRHLWLAHEGTNTIQRYDAGTPLSHFVAPDAMAQFPANGGVESLVRLRDGRFIALGEVGSWKAPRRRVGLLFDRDPVDGGKATAFFLRPPPGYDPSDAAALPDGRIIILLRGFSMTGIPPFSSRLIIADPRDIRPGKAWPWKDLLDLDSLVPRENYEGLAVQPRAGGSTLWLISDDNRCAVFQRTLLVALNWEGGGARTDGTD